jgi:serine/threonine protein phosphatase 1
VAVPPCDSEPFGRLRQARRVWAVGAIRGEAERLAALHETLARRFHQGDRIVYLGDCLGYGDNSAGAVDALIEFRRAVLAEPMVFLGDVVMLRGSQEEMWQRLQELQFAPNPREVLGFMLEHGVAATLASYGIDTRAGVAAARDSVMAMTRWTASIRTALAARPGHRAFATLLRRAAFTEEGSLLFVNAGIDAGKPIELQRDVFWWGGSDVLALAEPFSGFRRVVCGAHRRHAGIVETEYGVALDGGAGHGGKLCAACFAPDGRLVDRIEA